LTISESLVVAGGAVFFWFLSLILFFSGRYPDKFKNLPFYLLTLALAIDSSLIGFQFFTIQQRCLLCLTVAALLILVAIFYCIARKSFVILICFILIWLGGFGVHKIMIMPAPQGAYHNMVFYSTIAENHPVDAKVAKMTLIMSMNCPHCLDVVSYLSNNYPVATDFRLVTIDQDRNSLKKISTFMEKAAENDNPFKLLKSIKNGDVRHDQVIDENLPKKATYGLQFLNNLGITSIPVLVAESIDQDKRILVGADAIIDFFRNDGESRQTHGEHIPQEPVINR
jgi:glutaredoxin-related protein